VAGSWYGLLSVLTEARQYMAEDAERRRMACPNDGQPYLTGPDGHLYCPWDGYRPDDG